MTGSPRWPDELPVSDVEADTVVHLRIHDSDDYALCEDGSNRRHLPAGSTTLILDRLGLEPGTEVLPSSRMCALCLLNLRDQLRAAEADLTYNDD